MKIKEIEIRGTRYFSPEGNTYHNAYISVDGEHIHTEEYVYGYGGQYLYTGMVWLRENGYIEGWERGDRDTEPSPWRWAAENGIKLEYSAEDVKRKRDM